MPSVYSLMPLAARDPDFAVRLRELGLEVGSSPELLEIIGAFSEAIDAHTPVGERSDQQAIGRLATSKQFSDLARDFFARLTRRHLTYYLSRELSNHVGLSSRFRSIAAF